MRMRKISETQRAALLSARPDDRVRIYSIQSQAAADEAARLGYWTVPPGWYAGSTWTADNPGEDEFCWQVQYDWMRDQMGVRLPAASGDYPIWAWLHKPNQRQWRWLGPEPHVLVTADLPMSRVLISDFEHWHCCLNCGPCVSSEEEYDQWYEGHPDWRSSPSCITPEMKETWKRVLDLRRIEDQGLIAWQGQCDTFQVCADRIYRDEVVRISPFMGRIGRNGGF